MVTGTRAGLGVSAGQSRRGQGLRPWHTAVIAVAAAGRREKVTWEDFRAGMISHSTTNKRRLPARQYAVGGASRHSPRPQPGRPRSRPIGEEIDPGRRSRPSVDSCGASWPRWSSHAIQLEHIAPGRLVHTVTPRAKLARRRCARRRGLVGVIDEPLRKFPLLSHKLPVPTY